MGQKTAARNGRIGWILKKPFFFHFMIASILDTLFSKNVPYFFHLSDIQRNSNQKKLEWIKHFGKYLLFNSLNKCGHAGEPTYVANAEY